MNRRIKKYLASKKEPRRIHKEPRRIHKEHLKVAGIEFNVITALARPKIGLPQAVITTTFANEFLHQVGITPYSIFDGLSTEIPTITAKELGIDSIDKGFPESVKRDIISAFAEQKLKITTLTEAIGKCIKLDKGYAQVEAVLLMGTSLEKLPLEHAIVKTNTMLYLAESLVQEDLAHDNPHTKILALKLCDYVITNYDRLLEKGTTVEDNNNIVAWRSKLYAQVTNIDKKASKDLADYYGEQNIDERLRKEKIFIPPEQLSYAKITPDLYTHFGVRTCEANFIAANAETYMIKNFLENSLLLHVGSLAITDSIYKTDVTKDLVRNLHAQIWASHDITTEQKEMLSHKIDQVRYLSGNTPQELAKNLYENLPKGAVTQDEYLQFITPYLISFPSDRAVDKIEHCTKVVVYDYIQKLVPVTKELSLREQTYGAYSERFLDKELNDKKDGLSRIGTLKYYGYTVPTEFVLDTVKQIVTSPRTLWNYFRGNSENSKALSISKALDNRYTIDKPKELFPIPGLETYPDLKVKTAVSQNYVLGIRELMATLVTHPNITEESRVMIEQTCENYLDTEVELTEEALAIAKEEADQRQKIQNVSRPYVVAEGKYSP